MSGSAPCATWPVIWPCDVTSVPATGTATALAVATDILWAMSGRQFGECTLTVRPCRRDCYDYPWPMGWTQWSGGGGPYPALVGGLWLNLTCGSCTGDCSCRTLEQILLPGPITKINAVKIDGSPLATGSYKLYDARWLIRTDGGRWPVCNDLTKDDGATGTWSVNFNTGVSVPTSGQLAMGELACEVIKALQGKDCRLPRMVTQLVRQGVTIQLPGLGEQLKEGLIGLTMVDMFIKAVNPARLPSRSRVYSIDHPRARRPT